MKRKKRMKVMSLLLAAALCIGFLPVHVSAAGLPLVENMQISTLEEKMDNPDVFWEGNPQKNMISRDASYLIGCSIAAGFKDYGLHIQFETSTTKQASQLGVKDIKVQQKNGLFWDTIATSSGGYVNNDDWYLGTSDCTNAVSGKTYRIKCTHYAYIGGNYYYYDHTSDSFTYVKP